jgi:hypothetical protein
MCSGKKSWVWHTVGLQKRVVAHVLEKKNTFLKIGPKKLTQHVFLEAKIIQTMDPGTFNRFLLQ